MAFFEMEAFTPKQGAFIFSTMERVSQLAHNQAIMLSKEHISPKPVQTARVLRKALCTDDRTSSKAMKITILIANSCVIGLVIERLIS